MALSLRDLEVPVLKSPEYFFKNSNSNEWSILCFKYGKRTPNSHVISGKENGNLDYCGDTKNEEKWPKLWIWKWHTEECWKNVYLYSNTTKIIYLYSLNGELIVGAQCQMKMWGLVFKNEEF